MSDENESNVTSGVMREVRKIANSPADTVLKYIVVGVMILFSVVFYFSWQSNQSQPERLYSLLEKSVTQQAESLRVQEQSLTALREFSIRVPLEHSDHGTKLALVQSDMQRLCSFQEEIRQAILKNTEAISRLIESWEKRGEQLN